MKSAGCQEMRPFDTLQNILMFCAFDGKPEIVRLHGQGDVYTSDDEDYAPLAGLFPDNPGARAIVHVQVTRISTSCGFAVPFMDYKSDRDTLDKWAVSKGPDGLDEYRATKNVVSIDGMPAFSR